MASDCKLSARENMAESCAYIARLAAVGSITLGREDIEPLRLAAAELRKVCASCAQWSLNRYPDHGGSALCLRSVIDRKDLPLDGSGFCHCWEKKL